MRGSAARVPRGGEDELGHGSGWDSITVCDDFTSTVWARARLAMKRSAAGGIA